MCESNHCLLRFDATEHSSECLVQLAVRRLFLLPEELFVAGLIWVFRLFWPRLPRTTISKVVISCVTARRSSLSDSNLVMRSRCTASVHNAARMPGQLRCRGSCVDPYRSGWHGAKASFQCPCTSALYSKGSGVLRRLVTNG